MTPGSGAFPSKNTNFGWVVVSDTIRLLGFNALQIRVKQDIGSPFKGVRHFFWLANYNLSRNNSTAPDQDVVYLQNAHDNLRPSHYFGANSLDRTHMFSFAATFEFAGGLQLTMLTRINSALSNTLNLPLGCGCQGKSFQSDITGDGTAGDVLPGTNVGAFGRSVKVASLNGKIDSFNTKYAGQLTPAGQALVAAGVISVSQLQQLGGVVQPNRPRPQRTGGYRQLRSE